MFSGWFSRVLICTGIVFAPIHVSAVLADNQLADNHFANHLIAHNIQVAGDVAGLWHVEPNHNPRAGEETKAWVALTRKGGKIIPFTSVNCAMGVYRQPRQKSDKPILQPVVTAISAEKYRDIPGAKINFPQPGLYQLQLDCQANPAANFKAFTLTHDVTVLAGNKTSNTIPTPINTSSTPKATNNPIQNPSTPGWNLPVILAIPAIILAVGGLAVWMRSR